MNRNTSLNRRRFLYGAGAVLGTSMLGLGAGYRAAADSNGHKAGGGGITLFENGVILPVDGAFSEHDAMAIADRRVVAVGSRETLRASLESVDRVVDLGGKK